MSDTGRSLKEIKKILDNYLAVLEKRPMMPGTIAELESNFSWMDKLNIVMTYGSSLDHNELSWQSFLHFRGISGPNENAAGFIFSSDDPFHTLKELRNEYYGWVDRMIAHRNHPSEGHLTAVLEKADERGALVLLTWFSRYPSPEAIAIYSQRIGNDYSAHPAVACGIARMGDEQVVRWAAARLDMELTSDGRRQALECIACSPLEEADAIAGRIIDTGNLDDIHCLVCAFADSMSRNKFARIEQILDLTGITPTLRAGIEFLLAGSLKNEDRTRAGALLKKIDDSR